MIKGAVICAMTLCTAAVAAIPGGASGAAAAHAARTLTARPPAIPSGAGPTSAGTRLSAQGYLVPDQAGYDQQKTAAAQAAGAAASAATTPSTLKPATVTKWAGVRQATVAPSDSTGAVGPTRYVELVNDKFGIYDRTVTPPSKLSTGNLTAITNDCSGCFVTDPQVIWDPTTNRFYYTVLDFTAALVGSGSNYLDIGFSKGSDPNSASDWCQYFLSGYGLDVPDYPKLGDTSDFWMIGSNLFDASNNFLAALTDWLTKPAGTGTFTACPDPSTFSVGEVSLLNTSGGHAFTPVPANQTDGSSTGQIIALPAVPTGAATTMLLYTVTNSSGSASFSAATSIPLNSYAIPPGAPESGSTFLLDTLDGRFTQAVSAVDGMCLTASGGPAVGLWTQHTVAGGAGSQVRWVELNTSTHAICQRGSVTSSTLYAFDGAVSPDRLVNGSTAMFGSDMVLGYDTSSASTDPAIQMISSVAHAAAGASVKIIGASGPYIDGFTCTSASTTCRWGDYAAATPDPSPALATASEGQVWLTNMCNNAKPASGINANWKTENWAATP